MNADFAFLAEHAAGPPDGKLYVNGGAIRRLESPNFPAVVALLSLVVSLRVPRNECGRDYTLRWRLLDEDGNALFEPPAFTVNAPPNPDSGNRPSYVNVLANLGGVVLPRPGDYAFSLTRDDDQELASVGFYVVQEPPALPAAPG